LRVTICDLWTCEFAIASAGWRVASPSGDQRAQPSPLVIAARPQSEACVVCPLGRWAFVSHIGILRPSLTAYARQMPQVKCGLTTHRDRGSSHAAARGFGRNRRQRMEKSCGGPLRPDVRRASSRGLAARCPLHRGFGMHRRCNLGPRRRSRTHTLASSRRSIRSIVRPVENEASGCDERARASGGRQALS
jgi:hypothetical protein